MSAWRERVGDLLYSGESVEDRIEVADASVVVTSHRVLAFDPEGDGPSFHQVDRPNVEGVTTGAQSETDLLERALRYGLVGVVLVGAGLVVDFGSIVGDVNLGGAASGELGLGGIMGTLQAFLNLIAQLDRLMRIFGALALVLAAVFVGVYWFTRDRTLVLEVGGGDDVHLPRPANADDVAGRLERAIAPPPRDGRTDTGGDETATPGDPPSEP